MIKIPRLLRVVVMIAAPLVIASGCEEDERLARMAKDATERQAQQNQEVVRLNREVAEGYKRLVEADAQARQETIALQKELVARDAEGRKQLNALAQKTQEAAQQERATLDLGKQTLEDERRQIATQRHRDPLIAAAISALGVTLACLLPLVIAIYALRLARQRDPGDGDLAELLTYELARGEPTFLFPPAITASGEEQPPRITGPETADRQSDGDEPRKLRGRS
jgi:hypothetical protein